VLIGFNALYLAANWLAQRRAQSNWWLAGSSLALAAVALAFTGFFFTFAPLAQRPVLLFGFVFLVDLAVAALARIDERNPGPAQPVAGLAVFRPARPVDGAIPDQRTAQCRAGRSISFLPCSTLLCPHCCNAVVLGPPGQRLWNHFFPPLALLLVLVPIFRLTELSFVVWPFVLLVDLLAIVLAALTGTLIPVLVVLLLTLAATAR
jgi:hypothetical protein